MAGASECVPDHRPPAAGIVLQAHGPPTCRLHHVSALSPRGLLCAHAEQEAERRHDSAAATARSCHQAYHRLLRHAWHRRGPASDGCSISRQRHMCCVPRCALAAGHVSEAESTSGAPVQLGDGWSHSACARPSPSSCRNRAASTWAAHMPPAPRVGPQPSRAAVWTCGAGG